MKVSYLFLDHKTTILTVVINEPVKPKTPRDAHALLLPPKNIHQPPRQLKPTQQPTGRNLPPCRKNKIALG